MTLVVQVPTNLNEAAKEALRKFDAETGDSLHTDTKGAEKPKKKSFKDKIKESLEDL